MRTIGAILRENRKKQNMSLSELSQRTKIRENFLHAIEEETWATLPDYPVVVGFVKNIADTLELDRAQTVALLRRDYPPKRVAVNPKPDVGTPVTWGPKLIFAIGAIIVIFAISLYLLIQYQRFTAPPNLIVENPSDNEIIRERDYLVTGRTDPEATVVVNNQPALVESSGQFSTEIAVDENTDTIEIIARSRGGRVTERSLSVDVVLE